MGALPWTLLLVGTSFILSAIAGIVLGVESSWRRGGRLDEALLTFMLLLDGIPSLAIGITALTVFCLYFGWFPSTGAMTPYSGAEGIEYIKDVLWHLVLPLATLTLSMIPGDYLLIRNSMMLTIREPYVLTARASMKLLAPNAVTSGQIMVGGTDISGLSDSELEMIRWNEIAIVFQNYGDVLNPVHRIIDQVAEPLIKNGESRSTARDRSERMLCLTNLLHLSMRSRNRTLRR